MFYDVKAAITYFYTLLNEHTSQTIDINDKSLTNYMINIIVGECGYFWQVKYFGQSKINAYKLLFVLVCFKFQLAFLK